MSIGAGYVLPDGVVLIADGRQTRHEHPAGGGDPIQIDQTDDVDKLHRITENFLAIPIGTVQVSDRALKIIYRQDAKSVEELIRDTELALEDAYGEVMEYVENKNADTGAIRSAFLMGGQIGGDSLIAYTGVDQQGLLDATIIRKPDCPIAVGGVKGLQEAFVTQLNRCMEGVEWDSEVGPVNEAVKEIIKAARDVIREAERKEGRVGGVLRYAVVRETFGIAKDLVYKLIDPR